MCLLTRHCASLGGSYSPQNKHFASEGAGKKLLKTNLSSKKGGSPLEVCHNMKFVANSL